MSARARSAFPLQSRIPETERQRDTATASRLRRGAFAARKSFPAASSASRILHTRPSTQRALSRFEFPIGQYEENQTALVGTIQGGSGNEQSLRLNQPTVIGHISPYIYSGGSKSSCSLNFLRKMRDIGAVVKI